MDLVKDAQALCLVVTSTSRYMEAVVASSMDWKDKFDMVFSDRVSGRFCEAMKSLGVSFTWDDPDGSYEDDVRAFVNAAVSRGAEVVASFGEIAAALKD